MTTFQRIGTIAAPMIAGLCLSLAAGSASAHIFLTPETADFAVPFSPGNIDANDMEIIVGTSLELSEVYKQNVGGGEEGPFASSYITEFFNSPSDPQDATITWVSGEPFITGDEIYALAKDGNAEPGSYVWDITGLWDGKHELEFEGLWPGRGAISHVSIFVGNGGGGDDGGDDGFDGTLELTEPSPFALLASLVVFIGLSTRRRNNKA